MSVMSALRSGVGLVELFSDKEICDVMFSQAPEAIYSEISKSDVDTDILKIMSKKSTATLIGCGLGKYDKRLVEEVILKSDSPVIVDADGINLICENINVVLNAKEKVVLTPHPAELSRICGVSVEEILKNRLFYAVKTARELNCIVVAKGADTFITDGHTVYLNCVGNTSLSKGGSGDILAGLICGIVAQGVNPLEACACGCYILGKTAEVLSESYSERGIVSSDIISAFPYVFKILDI
ncbi:MAG: NAD(P)H-hydrate dehydratase [Oscillospiraceae bacterium]|nr:NAD(P)H-hydrate dehydratase [Oscillospiraceae bacterium]